MLISQQQALLSFLVGLLIGFILTSLLFPFYDLEGNRHQNGDEQSPMCHCNCPIPAPCPLAAPPLREENGKNNGMTKVVIEIEDKRNGRAEMPKLISTTPATTTIARRGKEEGGAVDWHGHDEHDQQKALPGILPGYDDLGEMFFHHQGNGSSNGTMHNEANTLAAEIARHVRVFCWIMTGADNHESKAKHVKATWARRCNKFIFISAKENPELPAISLNISDGRDHLWGKTKAAFKYAYEHHLNEFDWFLKADDDTFVIVENLRFMLMAYSPEEKVYLGGKFSPIVRQGYMGGGAGYVLSKAALRLFVEKGIPDAAICRQDENGAEDAELGKCMERLGVRAGDSRDKEGHHRFFPFGPDHHLPPGKKDSDYWFWRNIYYDMDQGPGCCSDYAISFHYMNPTWMYVMEYVVYHLRPFGLDIPFGPEMSGIGQSEFELLGQSILENAKKLALEMMGQDDVNWRQGLPTLEPQIMPPKETTTKATPTTTAMTKSTATTITTPIFDNPLPKTVTTMRTGGTTTVDGGDDAEMKQLLAEYVNVMQREGETKEGNNNTDGAITLGK